MSEWTATTPEFWAAFELPVVAVSIWYADGTVSRDWSGSPAVGVQALMAHHPCGRRTLVTGRDEYTSPMGEPGSKLGLLIDETEFRRIAALAMADPWRP